MHARHLPCGDDQSVRFLLLVGQQVVSLPGCESEIADMGNERYPAMMPVCEHN